MTSPKVYCVIPYKQQTRCKGGSGTVSNQLFNSHDSSRFDTAKKEDRHDKIHLPRVRQYHVKSPESARKVETIFSHSKKWQKRVQSGKENAQAFE